MRTAYVDIVFGDKNPFFYKQLPFTSTWCLLTVMNIHYALLYTIVTWKVYKNNQFLILVNTTKQGIYHLCSDILGNILPKTLYYTVFDLATLASVVGIADSLVLTSTNRHNAILSNGLNFDMENNN